MLFVPRGNGACAGCHGKLCGLELRAQLPRMAELACFVDVLDELVRFAVEHTL
jgi:hypothetical protein